MRCRWDMQDSPPDILITNNSMLSIMLMRSDDSDIFEKTKEWLQESPRNVFHLILDELHLYRGTAGTEVAFLVRLLLLRFGLTPNSPQLRLLASSASLDPQNSKSLEFLSGFYGCPWQANQIILGRLRDLQPAREGLVPAADFIRLSQAVDAANEDRIGQAVTSICSALGCETTGDTASKAGSAFASIASNVVLSCSTDGTPSGVRAVALPELASSLFAAELSAADKRAALRGVFILRGLSGQGSELTAFRFHWFFRNIEGLWGCVVPSHGMTVAEGDRRTVGKLFGASRIFYTNAEGQGRRVLELLYCEVCGTTLFGGTKLPIANNGGWELLNTDFDIEGIPDRQAARFVDRRNYAEYGVFWPDGAAILHQDASGTWSQQLLRERGTGNAARQTSSWRRARLNPHSGRVQLGNPQAGFISGYFFTAATNNPAEHAQLAALPSICPCCASDYTKRVSKKSPIRGFRTGFSKVSQILAKELFYELPPVDRKLVVFSDSREDAAGISNGIERNHYDDLVREALYDELMHEALGESSLLNDIAASVQPLSGAASAYSSRNPAARQQLEDDLVLERNPVPQGLPSVQRSLLESARGEAIARLSAIRQRGETRRIPAEILLADRADARMAGLLIKRLKSLGVNPAGADVLYQEFKYAPRDYRRWTELFDYEDDNVCWQVDGVAGPILTQRQMQLIPKVAAEVSGVLFSRNYFSFESCGLGTRIYV